MNALDKLRHEIEADKENEIFTKKGYAPLYVASETAKLVIVGHAPGLKAQEAQLAWGDISGERLMDWLGISEKLFRDERKISFLPMDFYYQGKGKTGDLPPRKDFAPKWHPKILKEMPHVKLMILTGAYAQHYYLGKEMKKNLTETVKSFQDYLPAYFPLVHPSPLNLRWMKKNPWFAEKVLPKLKEQVKEVLDEV